ncbi:metal-dependent hydrolase [Tamlana sp. 2_MG-2023]|uniref:metal-dependent hydrolase n=1 Tax=unclassified Tamlana TaxID=2614803 RepID=UPI0026E18441|nr:MULTISPECIES: metal-dependent hydrolase [unclassified Tamlana]MDO6760740.1 metal-dependent hydrolase [Tamlana sp. 2_MG-2023]MDO6790996.1 metal-dependent hydrolase [Tamlana sp. 1_MG-2023]
MASIFGHGVVGYALTKLVDQKDLKWLLFAAIFSTVLPDFDVVAFRLGIPYEHALGHRGLTHSISFAFFWALFLMLTLGRKNKIIWFFVVLCSTLSHGVLDAMTSGGKGVGFFIPFDNSRYFFPFRPIKVSPIGVDRFFSEWGLKVLYSEFVYIGLPCIIVLVILYAYKKYNGHKKRTINSR